MRLNLLFENIELNKIRPITRDKLYRWLESAVPIFVQRFMKESNSIKSCSSISPAFALVSRHYKIPAYVVNSPGHVYNVVITTNGPVIVDLSDIQFKLQSVAKQFEFDSKDPYGEKRATKQLLQQIIEHPMDNIKIEPYRGSMDSLYEPEIGSFSFTADDFIKTKKRFKHKL